MKSLQELNAIKERMQQASVNRKVLGVDDVRIVVGMATCGIAAGARPAMQAFIEEVAKRKLGNVVVSQTGCAGMCKFEPMVDVFIPNQAKVTYVKVTPEVAIKIINDHVVNGNLVTENLMKNV